ncbi:MAG: DUF3368 domain-containing protein [Anaerolineales bacterium]|nr:DUF3368 domain-containing protein [Anaerolineales bacterium]
MKAVSNSSVLISLSLIGQLDLLRQRFPEGILVPAAVWHEVVESAEGRSGAEQVAGACWIEVKSVTDADLVTMLKTSLDAGEAEAIALAREQNMTIVLLDEKDARKMARKLSLSVLGTVGILIWAKRAGIIEDLRSLLDVLQQQGGFRVSRSLYLEALAAVGEYE